MQRNSIPNAFIVCCLFAVLIAPCRAAVEDNCHKLEALAQQYAGVELTSDQKQLKRRLTVWYNNNCHERRAVQASD
jgi:hypothetical protein